MGLKQLLNIDENEGISLEEVEAIKSTLSRITVVLTEIADTNGTSKTLQILEELESVLRRATRLGIFSVEDLHQHLAQNRSGQPAAALGGGSTSPTPNNAREGLQAILGDASVDQGIKEALRRLLTPSDPEHIPVGRDGTPAELVATRHERDAARQQRDTAITEQNKARHDLDNERDASRNGSLAKRLSEAEAERDRLRNSAGSGSNSVFDLRAAKAARDQVYEAIDGLTAKFGGVKGKDKLNGKFEALLTTVNVPLRN